MKISKSRLKQIIKEELESVISEEEDDLEENLHEEEDYTGKDAAKKLRKKIEKLTRELERITKQPKPGEKKEAPVKPRQDEGVHEDDEGMVNEEDICEKLRTGGRSFRRSMKMLCDNWTTINDQMPDVAGPKPKYCDCPEMQ